MERIIKKVKLKIPSDKAFRIFVNEINEWWPREYTWSQDKLMEIKIEGREDGLCTEIGPYGFRCDWGRVTEFIDDKKIALKWQISPKREPVPNPDQASDLKLEFQDNADTSTLIFEHLNFGNHGDGAEDYKVMMDSEQGWDYILKCYQKYCSEK